LTEQTITRRPSSILWSGAFIVLLLSLVPLRLFAAENRPFELKVASVSINGVTRDRITLSVVVEVSSSNHVAAKNWIFSSFQLNGVPIYLPPITERLEIQPNQPTQRTIVVTVFLRDLDSLQPLITAIESQQIKVQGTVRADVEVGLLATIVLLSRTAPVEIAFESSSPVRIPGGPRVRNTAIRVLRAADRMMAGVGNKLGRFGRGSQRKRAITETFGQAVLLAGCQYDLRNAKGELRHFVFFRAATRISDKDFLASTELLEPWRYDPATALLLDSGGWSLAESQPDVRVWLPGDTLNSVPDSLPSGGYALRSQDIRLVATGSGQESTVAILDTNGKPRRIPLRSRGAKQNVALFEFRQPPAWTNVPVDISSGKGQIQGAFRTVASWHLGKVSPEFVPIAVGSGSGEITLVDPLDSSGWGAPLITENSVVGIVLDEKKAVTLAEIKKLIKKGDAK
jgi:hypothetical protein